MQPQPNEPPHKNPERLPSKKELELAKKMGYVQGVCLAVVSVGDEKAMGKKILAEMNVTRDLAQKYANHETFKKMEEGVFVQTEPEQTRGRGL